MTSVGICTRFFAHEATYAAIVLADWMRARDIPVSMLSVTNKVTAIDRHWNACIRETRQLTFTDWASEKDIVIWTHCPHYEQLQWCRDNQIKSVILSLWHELEAGNRPAYQLADLVLSPSQLAARMLQSRWQVSRSIPLPISLNLPLFRRDPESRGRRLLLPTLDGAARRMEMTVLEIMDRLLATFSDLTLTVAYSSSTLAAYAYSRLKRLQKSHDENRVQLVAGIAWHDRPLLFQRHDLTIWPTQAESTCIVGLMSLAMGSPLACFEFPPLNELVTHDNSLLAPCGVSYDSNGAVVCRPDFNAFEETLHQGLKTPARLRMLQQMTTNGLESRHVDFSAIMQRVLT